METMRQMSCKKLYKFQILDFLILRTRGSFTLEKRWKDGKKVKLCLAIWWRGGISEVKKLKIPRVVLAMSALTIPAAVDWSRGQQQRYHYETEDLSTPNAYCWAEVRKRPAKIPAHMCFRKKKRLARMRYAAQAEMTILVPAAGVWVSWLFISWDSNRTKLWNHGPRSTRLCFTDNTRSFRAIMIY